MADGNLFSDQEKRLSSIKKEQNFKIFICCRDKLGIVNDFFAELYHFSLMVFIVYIDTINNTYYINTNSIFNNHIKN
jgi:hypothetical protein